jgi:CDGSH-type Zn-finger protein
MAPVAAHPYMPVHPWGSAGDNGRSGRLDGKLEQGISISILEEFLRMADVKITVRPNGPYRVEGAVTLVDADGKEWDVSNKPAFSLCRCGASVNKPFCDGTHSKIGFQAAEAAVRAEDNLMTPGDPNFPVKI